MSVRLYALLILAGSCIVVAACGSRDGTSVLPQSAPGVASTLLGAPVNSARYPAPSKAVVAANPSASTITLPVLVASAPPGFSKLPTEPPTPAQARLRILSNPIGGVWSANTQIQRGQQSVASWSFGSGAFDPNCGSINWTITGLPTGVTGSYNPTTTTPTGSTTLTISAGSSAAFGTATYQITATCTGKNLTGASAGGTSQTLGIYELPTDPVVPSPASNAITVVQGKTGSWSLADSSPAEVSPLSWQAWGANNLTFASATSTFPYSNTLSIAVGPTASPGGYAIGTDVFSDTSYGESSPLTLYYYVITLGQVTPSPNPTPVPTASPKPTASPSPSPAAVPGGYVFAPVAGANLKVATGSSASVGYGFPQSANGPGCGCVNWTATTTMSGVTAAFSPPQSSPTGGSALVVNASANAKYGVGSVSIVAKCTGSSGGAGTTASVGVYALPTLALSAPPYNVPWVANNGTGTSSLNVSGSASVFPVTWGVAAVPATFPTGGPRITYASSTAAGPGAVGLTMNAAGLSSNTYLYHDQAITARSASSYGEAYLPIVIEVSPPGGPSPAPIATPTMVPGCFADMAHLWGQYCLLQEEVATTLPVWTFATPVTDASDGGTLPDYGETCSVQSWSWLYPIMAGYTATAIPGTLPTNCSQPVRAVGSVTVTAIQTGATPPPSQLLRLSVPVLFTDPDDSSIPGEYQMTKTETSQNGFEVALSCNCNQDLFKKAGATYGVDPYLLAAIADRESGGDGGCNSMDPDHYGVGSPNYGMHDDHHGYGIMGVDDEYHYASEGDWKHDPQTNVNVAAKYIASLLRRHGYTLDDAESSYNGGNKFAIPNPPDYSQKIDANTAHLKNASPSFFDCITHEVSSLGASLIQRATGLGHYMLSSLA